MYKQVPLPASERRPPASEPATADWFTTDGIPHPCHEITTTEDNGTSPIDGKRTESTGRATSDGLSEAISSAEGRPGTTGQPVGPPGDPAAPRERPAPDHRSDPGRGSRDGEWPGPTAWSAPLRSAGPAQPTARRAAIRDPGTVGRATDESRYDPEEDETDLSIYLHHAAFPKLAAAGYLDYDAKSNTARYRGWLGNRSIQP